MAGRERESGYWSGNGLYASLFAVIPGAKTIFGTKHPDKVGKIIKTPVVRYMRQVLVMETRIEDLLAAAFQALFQYPTAKGNSMGFE